MPCHPQQATKQMRDREIFLSSAISRLLCETVTVWKSLNKVEDSLFFFFLLTQLQGWSVLLRIQQLEGRDCRICRSWDDCGTGHWATEAPACSSATENLRASNTSRPGWVGHALRSVLVFKGRTTSCASHFGNSKIAHFMNIQFYPWRGSRFRLLSELVWRRWFLFWALTRAALSIPLTRMDSTSRESGRVSFRDKRRNNGPPPAASSALAFPGWSPRISSSGSIVTATSGAGESLTPVLSPWWCPFPAALGISSVDAGDVAMVKAEGLQTLDNVLDRGYNYILNHCNTIVLTSITRKYQLV